MIRHIEWLAQAEADLDDLPWRVAADVAEAVKLFALTGIGPIVRFPNLAVADEHRLYVPPSRYYARIRYSARVVYIERVLRSP